MKKLLSFCIPCYRSEKTIKGVCTELIETVSKRDEYDYEIILVNDHSPDNVYKVIKEMAGLNPKIKGINFTKNYGKASACLAGFAYCKGEIIINLDDDGQCPGDRLFDLVDAIVNNDADIAYADYPVKKESFVKRFGSAVNTAVMNFLIDQPEDIRPNNMIAIRDYVIKEMIKYQNPYPALHPLMMQISHTVAMVPMEERDRADDNASGFTFFRSVKHLINGWTNFSVKPLRLATVLGMSAAVCGFIYGIFIICQKLLGLNIEKGYASLMVAILVIGGLIMMLLGIIGEYLGRLYICINNSPQYVIKEKINMDNPQ